MAKKKGSKSRAMERVPGYASGQIIVTRKEKVKRAAKRVGRAALEPTGLFLSGGAYGYAESEGWLDKVPVISDFPRSSTLALAAALMGGLKSSNKWVREGSLAAIVVGGVDMGHYVSAKGKDKKTSGEKPDKK